jgi:hypothetical protein
MQKFGVEYKVNEWRLLIDSSKRSLKAVLLHNGNNNTSLSIGRSVQLQECYDDLELFLTKIGFTAHDWIICGDLKLVCMILGQQADYTKYQCFMCEWDSRARNQHWEQKHRTPRTSLESRSKNILRKNHVDPKKILLSTLHIKLGIVKQSVTALPKTGNCFKYLCKNFSSFAGGQTKRGRFCWS